MGKTQQLAWLGVDSMDSLVFWSIITRQPGFISRSLFPDISLYCGPQFYRWGNWVTDHLTCFIITADLETIKNYQFAIPHSVSRSITYFQIIQCSLFRYWLLHRYLFKLMIWYALISSWYFTMELETDGVHSTTTMRSKWIFQTGTSDFVRKGSAMPLC